VLDKPDVKAMPDLNLREYAMFVPLVVLVLVMGIYPASFRDVFEPSVTKLLSDFHMQVDGGHHG